MEKEMRDNPRGTSFNYIYIDEIQDLQEEIIIFKPRTLGPTTMIRDRLNEFICLYREKELSRTAGPVFIGGVINPKDFGLKNGSTVAAVNECHQMSRSVI
jgi:hypothetical protein